MVNLLCTFDLNVRSKHIYYLCVSYFARSNSDIVDDNHCAQFIMHFDLIRVITVAAIRSSCLILVNKFEHEIKIFEHV